MIERSNSTRNRYGIFKITAGLSKPRHVFIYIINDANLNLQTANPFLYNSFSVVNNQSFKSWKRK